MPKDGHLTLVPLESEEVEDEGVDNLVREGVLLVEKDADEETVGTCSCRTWSIFGAEGSSGREFLTDRCTPFRQA